MKAQLNQLYLSALIYKLCFSHHHYTYITVVLDSPPL